MDLSSGASRSLASITAFWQSTYLNHPRTYGFKDHPLLEFRTHVIQHRGASVLQDSSDWIPAPRPTSLSSVYAAQTAINMTRTVVKAVAV